MIFTEKLQFSSWCIFCLTLYMTASSYGDEIAAEKSFCEFLFDYNLYISSSYTKSSAFSFQFLFDFSWRCLLHTATLFGRTERFLSFLLMLSDTRVVAVAVDL